VRKVKRHIDIDILYPRSCRGQMTKSCRLTLANLILSVYFALLA
jgi:hypothetical protein